MQRKEDESQRQFDDPHMSRANSLLKNAILSPAHSRGKSMVSRPSSPVADVKRITAMDYDAEPISLRKRNSKPNIVLPVAIDDLPAGDFAPLSPTSQSVYSRRNSHVVPLESPRQVLTPLQKQQVPTSPLVSNLRTPSDANVPTIQVQTSPSIPDSLPQQQPPATRLSTPIKMDGIRRIKNTPLSKFFESKEEREERERRAYNAANNKSQHSTYDRTNATDMLSKYGTQLNSTKKKSTLKKNAEQTYLNEKASPYYLFNLPEENMQSNLMEAKQLDEHRTIADEGNMNTEAMLNNVPLD